MKKWVLTFAIFFLGSLATAYWMRHNILLIVYKLKHPGLINHDYGILSKKDLSKAEEEYLPPLPFDGTDSSYPYWQCFHKKHLKADCSYQEPVDKQGTSLEIAIEMDSEIHSYSLSHAVSGEVCKDLINRINSLLRSESYFCINGGSGTLGRAHRSKKEYSWTFHDFKTRVGYANLSQEYN